ncbi:MAG: hypothetical protein JOY79_11115 [Acidobacteriaceae bacterium]|nr:hypothetical protein [Acidobacteriaceae bacterium]
MSRIFLGFISTLLVAGTVLYLEMKASTPAGVASPKTTIDTVGVENELLAIGNTERQQFALEGKYVSIDDLQAKSGFKVPPNAPYSYSVDFNNTEFRATATYTGPQETDAPRLMWVDQTMQLHKTE